MLLKIKIKRLVENAKLPTKAYDGDLGFDLYSIENVLVKPNEKPVSIKTGIAVQLPKGYGAIIKDRSSLASDGLHIVAGVIDNGYRGEIIIKIANLTDRPILIEEGSKIAQLILIPIVNCYLIETDKLSITERNDKGFGSSGIK
jgi:dUTP pyrophosphatase